MSDFILLVDSTSDLSKDMREEYGIEYVPMNYVVDGVEYPALLDWEAHSPKEFYDMIRGGKRVTTTQVSREIYVERFTECLKAGKDVVYIACSSALSGSINLATVVAKELKEEYPDNTVYCIDSLISSLGQGGLAFIASEMRKEGKSAAEVAAWLEENRLKMNQAGTVESLEYLRRAGRVKASKAFFGNLFGVKPIIISDISGQNYAYKKAKGALNAKIAIADHLAGEVIDPESQTLYISHADALADAEQLRDIIMEKVPFAGCKMNYIAPIVGSCVGPGTIIAFCFGKEVTIQGE
jgi:DegV family protein with EDD domain